VIGGGLPVGALGGKAEIMDHLAPLGKVYQAGTLSGNPLAMAAGLAQLEQLDSLQGFARLEVLGAQLEAAVRAVLKQLGLRWQFYRVGSMFCLFLTEQPVLNLTVAMTADRQAFGRIFHALLEAGVYLPPSQFETCFLSLAHSEVDIAETVSKLATVLKNNI
jgi:glutamate-1-semialdehyde 2,1-aminomutase